MVTAVPPSAPARTAVFVTYSHRDAVWLERVRVHLKPLEREHGIEIWDDGRIRSGEAWREEIDRALRSARIALLLVSADFLSSEFIVDNELPPLLEEARRGGAIILPLIVSASRFASTALARFQAVNDPARPLNALTPAEQEAVLVRMTERIVGALQVDTGMQFHVSPHVLSTLREDPTQLTLAGRRRHVTLLRTDIRGFTLMNEQLDPEDVASLIRDYLTVLTGIVFDLDGTLDRYAGHVLTAYWGAPVAVDDAADRASTAALRMIEAVEKMNPELQHRKMPPLRLQITLTSGDVIVGNLGSDQRFNYGIVGEPVELLERLGRVAAQFSVNVLMTEFTCAELREPFVTKVLAEQLQVKGKAEPITVLELVSPPRHE
jgi:class 3 adenylate cyclase